VSACKREWKRGDEGLVAFSGKGDGESAVARERIGEVMGWGGGKEKATSIVCLEKEESLRAFGGIGDRKKTFHTCVGAELLGALEENVRKGFERGLFYWGAGATMELTGEPKKKKSD